MPTDTASIQMTAAVITSGAGISAAEFRDAMGHFATGVTVVTSVDADGEPVGTTANAVTSPAVKGGLASLEAVALRCACTVLMAGGACDDRIIGPNGRGGPRPHAGIPRRP